MKSFIAVLALASVAAAGDLRLGSGDGIVFFNETIEASPAIYKQVHNLTLDAGENYVISNLDVTDLREDKAGDVNIVDGGLGEQNVTIELKSPTILRGYSFLVQASATPAQGFLPPQSVSEDAPVEPETETTEVRETTEISDLDPAVEPEGAVEESKRDSRNAVNSVENGNEATTPAVENTTADVEITTENVAAGTGLPEANFNGQQFLDNKSAEPDAKSTNVHIVPTPPNTVNQVPHNPVGGEERPQNPDFFVPAQLGKLQEASSPVPVNTASPGPITFPAVNGGTLDQFSTVAPEITTTDDVGTTELVTEPSLGHVDTNEAPKPPSQAGF